MQSIDVRSKKPLYAHRWPETSFANVNVLCEGPSIEHFRACDLLIGPTVAVNHAISLSDRIPIDFWATVDLPSNLWDWAAPFLRNETKLFTTTNNILAWEGILGRDLNGRLYAKDGTFMVETKDHPAFLDESGRPALLPTVIHVIGWLGLLPGVNRVRLFGCDMRGSNSNLSTLPFSDLEEDGWDLRWMVERRLLALSIKQYRKRKRRLERWAAK